MRRDPAAELRSVEALIAAAREASRRSIITARYASHCAECGAPIAVGESIAWTRGRAAVHAACWTGELRQ